MILGLSGSPREGNTNYYVQRVLDDLSGRGHTTQFIHLKDKRIEGCTGCYGCVEAKRCVVDDDFQEIFDAMVGADALVVGTPVYNGSMTPKLKALLDRAGFSARWMKNELASGGSKYDWGEMTFSKKLFAPLTVARKTGQTFALAQLYLWGSVNDLITVGSNYWNVGTAGTGGAKDAAEDEEGHSITAHLAENLDYLLNKLK
jgi:multimeric flavodoxin WrbA